MLPIIPTPARSCLVLLFLAAAACGGGSGRPDDRVAASPAVTPSGPPAPASSNAAGTILAVGTSLTAGLGLDDPDQAWPGLVQKKIDAERLPFRVVNAGVSGETSAGAQRRIDWLLRQPVSVFILETGANDALRGQDPAATRANIEAILDSVRAKAPQAKILILGMRAPPNLGARYTTAFEAVYPDLARKHGAALVPFVLEGVGGIASLNQPDGVHPTPEGHRIMAETVWRSLRPLL